MHSRRRRTGSQAVEFALSLPVIIFVLSGVVDFSYYFHLQFNLINAVAQGTRAGIATDLLADPESVAEKVGADVWTASDLDGTPTFVAAFSGADPNLALVLTASMTYTRLVGMLPAPTQVTHTATMRMQDQKIAP